MSMSSDVRIVIIPVPVPTAVAWYDRHSQIAPREPKTSHGWPRERSPIPNRDAARRLVEDARQTLQRDRERKLMREFEQRP
jgi:hypothetical protein